MTNSKQQSRQEPRQCCDCISYHKSEKQGGISLFRRCEYGTYEIGIGEMATHAHSLRATKCEHFCKKTTQLTEAERREAGLLTIKLRLSKYDSGEFAKIARDGESPTDTLRRLISAEVLRKTRGRKNRQTPPK